MPRSKRPPALPPFHFSTADTARLADLSAYLNSDHQAITSSALQVLWLILLPHDHPARRAPHLSPLHISHAVQSTILKLAKPRRTK
jgi:hypothetical protein